MIYIKSHDDLLKTNLLLDFINLIKATKIKNIFNFECVNMIKGIHEKETVFVNSRAAQELEGFVALGDVDHVIYKIVPSEITGELDKDLPVLCLDKAVLNQGIEQMLAVAYALYTDNDRVSSCCAILNNSIGLEKDIKQLVKTLIQNGVTGYSMRGSVDGVTTFDVILNGKSDGRIDTVVKYSSLIATALEVAIETTEEDHRDIDEVRACYVTVKMRHGMTAAKNAREHFKGFANENRDVVLTDLGTYLVAERGLTNNEKAVVIFDETFDGNEVVLATELVKIKIAPEHMASRLVNDIKRFMLHYK